MQVNPKIDIVAVVVWYHPTEEQAQNILSYIHDVHRVIIVDNSLTDNLQLLSIVDSTSYTYIPLHRNMGVATALNIGCLEAIKMNAQWILTMDQDSCWDKVQLCSYIDQVNSFPALSQVGVFSPQQNYNRYKKKLYEPYEDKIAVMTSGSLISVKGFQLVGGFREDFFIDEVDNEYCMHIHRLGMRVVMINNALLSHQLGELRVIKLFGVWKKEYIYHAPFRYYYMIRNILVLKREYPEHHKFLKKRLKKLIKRVLIYNKWSKIETIQMCIKGWWDFQRHIMRAIPR